MGPNPNSQKCKKGAQNLTKNFRKEGPARLEEKSRSEAKPSSGFMSAHWGEPVANVAMR
jgi:hypothetical protein